MEALIKQQWRFSSLFKKLISQPRSMPLACSSVHSFTTSVKSQEHEEYANVNWDELGFSLTPTDYMYEMKCTDNFNFSQGNISFYGNIQLSPSSGILNYGQGLFEGLKAYRREDGQVLLFRPEQNAMRMQMGAERLCMPSPSVKQFVDAIKQMVQANKPWVPPPEKGSLYIRPLLMGSGSVLGVGPAPEYTFLIYASPVGNYFQGPLNLIIEDKVHRAIPNGTGGIKTITNYSPVFHAVAQAKARGFSDILYLDAVNRKYIEECSSSNIFILKNNVISTPATHGTILPGITRKSIIEIALGMNLKVVERNITVDDLLEAEEIFCTGTAMVVNPVGSITYMNTRIEYKSGAESLSQKLYETLAGIQKGLIKDKMGWTLMVGRD